MDGDKSRDIRVQTFHFPVDFLGYNFEDIVWSTLHLYPSQRVIIVKSLASNLPRNYGLDCR